MNNQNYIRKAVELVGWKWDDSASGYDYVKPPVVSRGLVKEYWLRADDPIILDALAAQLVRQVDPHHHVDITWMTCEVRNGETGKRLAYVEFRGTTPPYEGCNRTMNTIKAIVDSGVLA